MNSETYSPKTASEEFERALERFVIENDDLLALEQEIGRLNIFDALRVTRTEIRHSNFLAWLLDPEESHGQGDLFLKAILIDLFRSAGSSQRPISPVLLDAQDLLGVEIRREWRHIDLLIRCENPSFLIVIENKVDSSEHSNQLERYENDARDAWPDIPKMFVLLSPSGVAPSDEDWVRYSYADIHRVLTRVQQSSAGSLGTDTAVFLDHYLRLLRSRFMDDSRIAELCKRIYVNHRQAIELIVEHGIPRGQASSAILDFLENDGRFEVLYSNANYIEFVPSEWQTKLPPRRSVRELGDRPWIKWFIAIDPCAASLVAEVGPADDQSMRNRVINRLREVGNRFGLKVPKKVTPVYTRIKSKRFKDWDEESPPAPDELIGALKPVLDEWLKVFAGFPECISDVLKPTPPV